MIIQGTPEWFAARCGRVTASRIADVVAKTKTGWGASRASYMAQLVAERLTGTVAPSYENDAMRWGTEKEPDARAAYEFRHDVEVTQVGFIDHPTIAMAGASPDGLIDDDGMLEIKCPQPAAHLETLLTQKIPEKYVTQMMWQLACSGRQWVDYVSYNPTFPENMRLFIARVFRDDKRIDHLETEIAGFLLEMAVKLSELNSLYGEKEAA